MSLSRKLSPLTGCFWRSDLDWACFGTGKTMTSAWSIFHPNVMGTVLADIRFDSPHGQQELAVSHERSRGGDDFFRFHVKLGEYSSLVDLSAEQVDKLIVFLTQRRRSMDQQLQDQDR